MISILDTYIITLNTNLDLKQIKNVLLHNNKETHIYTTCDIYFIK
jgi:hypothetical protein